MKPEDFSKGLPIIINDFDAPKLSLIALCESYKDGILTAVYLTDYPTMERCSTSRIERATPVKDFGIELIFKGDFVYTEESYPCVATYKDGAPRRWQESPGITRDLAKGNIRKLIDKLLKNHYQIQENFTMEIVGKLEEVGNNETTGEIEATIRAEDRLVKISGLTKNEARECANSLYKAVTINLSAHK